MCLSGTADHGHASDGLRSRTGVDRRTFLVSGAMAAVGAVSALGPAPAAIARRGRARTWDLTHRLVKNFPDFFGTEPVISDSVLFSHASNGFYAKSWQFPEHIGTHIDAPGHFGPGALLVDELTTDQLVAPLVVVDIKDKVLSDPNAQIEVEDLVGYERAHGRIPDGALVAMNSGWQDRLEDADTFRGGVGFPDLNFPGFSIDATDWLVAKRDPVGIGVDTLSLDPGNSVDFAVHYGFLPTNRYGIENLANLDSVPPKGATVFVGAVPWEDGSGGPCRVIAVSR